MFASLALYVPHPVFLTLPLSQHKHSPLFRHDCLPESSLLLASPLLSQCTVGSLRVALVMVTCLWQGPLRGSMGLSRGTRNTKSAMSRIECIHGRYIYSSGKTTFLQYVTMMHQQQVPSWHFDKILLPKLGTSAHLNQQR